jgi:hypothetical protein
MPRVCGGRRVMPTPPKPILTFNPKEITMNTIFDTGLIWWITAVDLPVLSTLFWLILRTRREADEAIQKMQEIVDVRSTQLRGALAAFKLEVAKSYASVTDMKDLENRIVAHLLRIEAKLDQTALKTEALRGKKS